MLDDYKEKQPQIYRMMKNAVENQKLSHAYLIDTRKCSFGNNMVLAFVKYLLCPYQNSNNKKCGTCTQCNKIDDFNYTELKIINPDGMWIKKEQLDELQNEFSKKVIVGSYKIYIIHQAEKLNKAAANSLLKFLEEPEKGIIAVLTTDNIFQVLETIRSRCQILSFSKNSFNQDQLNSTLSNLLTYVKIHFLDQKNDQERIYCYINTVLKFVENIEKNGEDTLLYTNKLWHNIIKEKEEQLLAFEIMFLFYHDVLNMKCKRSIKFFLDKLDFVKFVSDRNNIDRIINKMDIIMNLKKKIKFNANNNLLIDKLILKLVGGDQFD